MARKYNVTAITKTTHVTTIAYNRNTETVERRDLYIKGFGRTGNDDYDLKTVRKSDIETANILDVQTVNMPYCMSESMFMHIAKPIEEKERRYFISRTLKLRMATVKYIDLEEEQKIDMFKETHVMIPPTIAKKSMEAMTAYASAKVNTPVHIVTAVEVTDSREMLVGVTAETFQFYGYPMDETTRKPLRLESDYDRYMKWKTEQGEQVPVENLEEDDDEEDDDDPENGEE